PHGPAAATCARPRRDYLSSLNRAGSTGYDFFADRPTPTRMRLGRSAKRATDNWPGHGAHYCVGAPLARLELKTVFTQLIQRFPSMHLTCDPMTCPNSLCSQSNRGHRPVGRALDASQGG